VNPAELARIDRAHLWHPFTAAAEWESQPPLIIERAEGNHLIDSDGRRYFDGVSSLWTNVHGHNHPAINQAIREQLDKVAHTTLLGLASPPSIELAAELTRLAPSNLTRVFYSDSGSTAVEIALKQSFQYWKQVGRPEKRRFVHLESAYHGDTVGAVSVGGIDTFHEVFGPLLFETLAVPSPHPFRHPLGEPEAVRDWALNALAEALGKCADTVAAVILEPLVQGAAGILVHPPGYLAGAARLCREHNVHLILDEVATGFGRTGAMFACEHEAVKPDFLCLAKGITGGYLPLAATLSTDEIYDGFRGPAHVGRTFFHGHTYTGNPVACAAALASLQIFRDENVLERVPLLVEALGAALARLAGHAHVGDVRQRGLMAGVELVENRDTAAPFPHERRLGVAVCQAIRERGVILRNLGDVVVVMPPLSSTADELAALGESLAWAIDHTVSAQ
jgi:adenosylmethionine-8-amino-7-oxononanoate aminotransferase